MGCLGQALSCRGEETPARPTTGPTGPVLPWDLGPGTRTPPDLGSSLPSGQAC